jgi:predicted phage-related endonuclease
MELHVSHLEYCTTDLQNGAAQMIQGSAEWFQNRLGNLTGSRIYDVCAKGKSGKYYASRDDLLTEKLIERLTGIPAQHFVTDAMLWGSATEENAMAMYETQKGILVESCAYFAHPTIAHSGATPDRLVGEDGVIEGKCPTTKVHLETILSGVIPVKHTYQMAWEIESAGRKWADFISYDPQLPGNLSFFCLRYDPAPEFMEYLRAEVIRFLDELARLEEKVRSYKGE